MDPTTTETARISKAALFRVIDYKPHPGQVLVHRSPAKRRVVACGARWGKTTAAVGEAAAAVLRPAEGSLGWIVGPSFDHADRIFTRTVEAIQRFSPQRIRSMDQRKRHVVVVNLAGGLSEMHAKSADQPTSLLGEGIDWLIVDEAARLSEEVWTGHLSQRLIDRDGWSLLLSTPKGCNWFCPEYRRGQRGRNPGCESWKSPSWENPHLKVEVVEAERGRLAREVFNQEYAAGFSCERKHPCLLCGYDPSPGTIWMGEDDDVVIPWPRCVGCGNPIHLDGVSRWTDVGSSSGYVPGPTLPELLQVEAARRGI